MIFKFLILLGAVELACGIVSTIRGHNLLASIRQPPSVLAGVGELAIGVCLIALGTVATLSARKRK